MGIGILVGGLVVAVVIASIVFFTALSENERLRIRVGKFFERVETQLKQILREANLTSGPRASTTIDAAANQIMALIEGRMSQYVRSNFQRKPTALADEQWAVLEKGIFQ